MADVVSREEARLAKAARLAEAPQKEARQEEAQTCCKGGSRRLRRPRRGRSRQTTTQAETNSGSLSLKTSDA